MELQVVALIYAMILGIAIELARPVAMLLVRLVSRWWLNPNHAPQREYEVYFNREYAVWPKDGRSDSTPSFGRVA